MLRTESLEYSSIFSSCFVIVYCFGSFFFFFFTVLGIKSRVLCMLGKHSTTELHPQPFFVWYLKKNSLFYQGFSQFMIWGGSLIWTFSPIHWITCHTPIIPALGKLRQEDHKFKGSLDYIGETLFQKKKNTVTFYFMNFFFFFTLLGFELKTLSLLGRCSTTWAIPLALFTLVIFR
jgi:hypothetical protein